MGKTGYFTHRDCWKHDMGGGHPECPQRLDAIEDRLLLTGVGDALTRGEVPLATLPQIARAHTVAHLEHLQELTQRLIADAPAGGPGHAMLDPDTLLMRDTVQAARRAAGAAIAATDAVMAGELENAFCAVRPPGHHACREQAMGFCFLNNVAIAARHALDVHGLERVAVVDFDVHHGNGTQDIFQLDPRVAYYSTHQAGLFPESGLRRDRGAGNLLNILLPPGSGSLRFRNVWVEEMLPAIDDFRPQLVLVSAGFDAHLRDPQADLMLEAEDFAWITTELHALARRHAAGRLVSMLEGGYDLQALAESSVAHVGSLLDGAGTAGR